MVKHYRTPLMTFKFPFRIGGRSLATGQLNKPRPGSGRPMPPIKQFSEIKKGRPKPRQK